MLVLQALRNPRTISTVPLACNSIHAVVSIVVPAGESTPDFTF